MCATPTRLALVTPVYQDWESLALLLAELARVGREAGLRFHVVAVNDSPTPAPAVPLDAATGAIIEHLTVLDLVRNLGHQRAIAVGLAYVAQHVPELPVVVMDADGEDQPADVARLCQHAAAAPTGGIVFAERQRRTEGPVFRVCYLLYKLLFRVLTGVQVRGGNFTLVPRAQLEALVHCSELWNHYAAAIVKSRLPYSAVPTQRGQRYRGQSRMGFVSLIAHGLSAISVFAEVAGIRMLVAALALAAVAGAGIAATVGVKFGTTLAIPGWATYTTGLLAIILLQSVSLMFVFVFLVLAGRNAATFLPLPDALRFIRAAHQRWPQP